MVAELERPTVELRKNILRNKIHRDGLQFPRGSTHYIAENVGDSVRDLEGIVISIMAHSTIYNKEIDLELTQRIVRKVVRSESINLLPLMTSSTWYASISHWTPLPSILNHENAKWYKHAR